MPKNFELSPKARLDDAMSELTKDGLHISLPSKTSYIIYLYLSYIILIIIRTDNINKLNQMI